MKTVVLADVLAQALLANVAASCFAPGADAAGLSDEELCARTVRVMSRHRASYYQRHMAVVAAATRGRYEHMVKAMSDHNMEPVIIEDLVKFGEDRGRVEGRAEGRVEGIRPLLRLFVRKLGRALSPREESLVLERLDTLGEDRLGDVALDFDGAQLAAWLSDPAAR
jgi:hypothetical protein